MSLRAIYLLLFGAAALHLPFWAWICLLVGYAVCEFLDNRRGSKAKDRVFEDEMEGWEPDPGDPSLEHKNGEVRVRLTGQEQIVAMRVAQLLWRML